MGPNLVVCLFGGLVCFFCLTFFLFRMLKKESEQKDSTWFYSCVAFGVVFSKRVLNMIA